MTKRHFLLHTGSFTERGDSVNIIELIRVIRDKLGAGVSVAIPASGEINRERLRELEGEETPVHIYREKTDLERFARRVQSTHTIAFSGGHRRDLPYVEKGKSFRLLDNVHITQVVFRATDFHGDFYLYVSPWLYKSSTVFQRRLSSFENNHLGGPDYFVKKGTFVSHWTHSVEAPVSIAVPTNLLKTGAEIVISRMGGFDQFSDRAAQLGVLDYLDQQPKAIFVAVNTKPFSNHSRVIHINYLSRNHVWELLRATNVALNGRRMGESFGFSIYEPLSIGVPVLAPSLWRNPLMDKNHIEVLQREGLLYTSRRDLVSKLHNLEKGWTPSEEIVSKVTAVSRLSAAKRLEWMLHLN